LIVGAAMVPEPIPATREIPIRPAVVKPLAPDTYKVQFTLSAAGYQKLRRAQDLLRHGIPNGDLAAVMERALTLLVENLEKKKLAVTRRRRASRPATRGSRHIPAAVRREVWRRDDGQCALVGSHGRCTERGLVEFHHVVPFADGGEASVDNVQLRCRAHNQHEAALRFGAHIVRENAPAYGSRGLGPDRAEWKTQWPNDMRPARPVDPATGFPELYTSGPYVVNAGRPVQPGTALEQPPKCDDSHAEKLAEQWATDAQLSPRNIRVFQMRWAAIVFGWPAAIMSILLGVLGVTVRRWTWVVGGALAGSPFLLYLSLTPVSGGSPCLWRPLTPVPLWRRTANVGGRPGCSSRRC
jgi:hypothetical protein